MPRNIDLTGGARPAAPPPPAGHLANLRGRVPAPTGSAVYDARGDVPDEHLLTERERSGLAAFGMKPGQKPPPGLAAAIAAARQESSNPPLPVPPDTPALRAKTVRLEDLPEADRRQLLERACEITEQARSPGRGRFEVVHDLGDEVDPSALQNVAPALAQGAAVAARAAADAARPPDPAPPAPPGPAAADSPSGAAAAPKECRHCGWPHDQPDDAEPTAADSELYTQALCGDRPFVKVYDLYGGKASAAFRTLTLAESDAVYRQAASEAKADPSLSAREYYERLARLRLYLQLVQLRLGDDVRDLPDGLSPQANPAAAGHYVTDPARPPLPQIEEWVLGTVLRQEPLFHAVASACRRFNGLVSGLQDRATALDFLPPTARGG